MDLQLGQFIYRDEKYKTNEKRQPGQLFNLSHTGKAYRFPVVWGCNL